MKSLQESLLDNDDELFGRTGIEELIMSFIKEHYYFPFIQFDAKKINIYEDNTVSIYAAIRVKPEYINNITSLTDGIFEFDYVEEFYCPKCSKLKSLEGAPKKCKIFTCSGCNNLKSLEGAPEIVVDDFSCSWCNNLKSLEGAPEKVGEIFNCESCRKLQTLKGAPKHCNGDFHCADCVSLNNLKFLPEKIEGRLFCGRCGKKFEKDNIKSISQVRGEIYN